MAENEVNQINELQKKPTISHVYHRRIRPIKDFDLPEELLIEILKRLPVSSLLRFMCVCKSWYSLITNPIFISVHASFQSKPTSKNCLTTLYNFVNRFFLHDSDKSLDDWAEINVPFQCRLSSIVGCCDGVICLLGDFSDFVGPLVLWNPSIKKAFTLPLPTPTFRAHKFVNQNGVLGNCNLYDFALGFGFDPISKDYKVVRVIYHWDVTTNLTYIHADFCGLSKDDWGTAHSCVEGGKFDINRRGICVNGVMHWMCKKKLVNNKFVKTVLNFDLAKERFGQNILPNPSATGELMSVKLVEDKLAVSSAGDDNNLWVMEKYGMQNSWKKLLDFYVADNMGKVLGAAVSQNGEFVVTTSVGNSISWDPSSQKLKNLALPILEPDFVDTYVRSLVLLKFKNQALQCKELPLVKKVKKRVKGHKKKSGSKKILLLNQSQHPVSNGLN